jgi:hypothetical protein
VTKEQFDKVNRKHTISDEGRFYLCSCGFKCKDHANMNRHKAEMFAKEEMK